MIQIKHCALLFCIILFMTLNLNDSDKALCTLVLYYAVYGFKPE